VKASGLPGGALPGLAITFTHPITDKKSEFF